jgi:cyclopropane-fatty-acyl-phospholipid synthase
VGSIVEAAGRRTDLVPTSLLDFGPDYAETLRRWRAELDGRRSEALGMGLDADFLRLWEFYLCYCEAGFEERLVSVVQMTLARPGKAQT